MARLLFFAKELISLLPGHMTVRNKEYSSQFPLQLGIALWLSSGQWNVSRVLGEAPWWVLKWREHALLPFFIPNVWMEICWLDLRNGGHGMEEHEDRSLDPWALQEAELSAIRAIECLYPGINGREMNFVDSSVVIEFYWKSQTNAILNNSQSHVLCKSHIKAKWS